MTVESSINTCA